MTDNGGRAEEIKDGDHDWFFDIIINFLRSPRWKTPIMSFLDEYCIVFDNEEENKLEYTSIHKEFKNLVDELIGCLIAELGVTQEQFMEACGQAKKNPVHKKIVDQIIAVDNFMAFKRLMCKRNGELNQQAIKMLQKLQTKAVEEEQKEEQFEEREEKPTPTPADPQRLLLEQQKTLKEAKLDDKDLQEALRVAQEADREEEEAFMKRALAESQALDVQRQDQETEEDEMMRKAIEASMREDGDRQAQFEEANLAEQHAREAQEHHQFRPQEEEPEPQNPQGFFDEDQEENHGQFDGPPQDNRFHEQQAEEQFHHEQQQQHFEQQQQEQYHEPPQEEFKQGPPQNMPLYELQPEFNEHEAAEQRKLDELRRLKKEAKRKKKLAEQAGAEQQQMAAQSQMRADALPAIQGRKGQFQVVPDFLQQKKKEAQRDMMALQDQDHMEDALRKQDQHNQNDGLSMAEMFAQKRRQTEDKMGNQQPGNGPTQSEKDERKERLMNLKKIREMQKQAAEQKRQEDLQVFNEKTETQDDLFNELKEMDNKIKGRAPQQTQADQRRLEIFRKARADANRDARDENEANYQKRVENMDKKKKKTEVIVDGDDDDFLKGIQTFGEHD